MFKRRTLRFAMLITTLAIAVNIALSDVTFAKHDRGRGRGRGHFIDKKRERFINRHDARDGRFDGRGPRRRFDDRYRFHRIPRRRYR
jgi:hypothetical protein